MIRLAPLLLWLLSHRTDGLRTGGEPDYNGTATGALDVAVAVDLSAVTHRVDPRFLSVTIDASLATEEKFMYLLG